MTNKTKYKAVSVVMSVLILSISLLCWFKPQTEYSDSERRKLKGFPKASIENVVSGKFMTDFEDYSLDQFPFRDSFRTLKAVTEFSVFLKKDNNDIYIEDGYLSKQDYPLNIESLDRAVDRFGYVYNKYFAGTGSKAYITVIPDKNYFLSEKSGHLSMDYDELFDYIREKSDFAKFIDIRDGLSVEDYYRTDTHWRQENLVPVAHKIAGEMGVTLSAKYKEKTLTEDFYGVYAGQSALPVKPERLTLLYNDILEKCEVYDFENDKSIAVYDLDKVDSKDPYEVYLSGSLSIITIDNPNAGVERELVIFRDSFSSSIAPLFAEGYAKITLIDIRYVHPDMLTKYIELGGQDVLFMYSTLVLNNSETIK